MSHNRDLSAAAAQIGFHSSNIGIGTDVPSAKLEVKSTGATAVFNSGAANDGRLEFEYNSSRVGLLAYHSDRLEIQTDSSKDFTIRTNGANERLRITSDGKVGINDTSPASLFTVNNGTTDSQCVNIKNDNVGLLIGTYGTGHGSYPREATINGTRTDSGTSPFLRIAGQGGIKFCVDLNTERLRITSDGDVKIKSFGNASNASADALQIGKTDNNYGMTILSATNAQGRIDFTDTEDTNDPQGKIAYYHDTNSLRFFTNGGAASNERLRINSDGQLLHTRTDNTTRYDLEFRQTGGISDGNYSGIRWSQGATGSTNLAAIEIEYADTGRPDIVFKTRQSGGAAMSEAARIDSVGRFRTANQPAFFVYRNQSSWSLSAGDTFTFNTAELNVGNHYNTSNGRFTAPITARYVFHFWSIYTGNASNDYVQMYKNGARIYGGDVHFTNPVGNAWDCVHYSRVIQLSSGDYVYMRSGSAHTYHGNHWGGWSGYMLG